MMLRRIKSFSDTLPVTCLRLSERGSEPRVEADGVGVAMKRGRQRPAWVEYECAFDLAGAERIELSWG